MKSRFAIVEQSLNRARARWKWLSFLQSTSILGCVLCLAAILFAVAVQRGVIVRNTTGIAVGIILLGLGLIAWCVLLIISVAGGPDRKQLGADLERRDRRFLNRLNTLLFLEEAPPDPKVASFASHIARQTRSIFARKPPRQPSWSSRHGFLGGALLAMAVATVLVYRAYPPWQTLAKSRRSAEVMQEARKPLEIPPPATNNLEQIKDWGEVRITDPGTDVKVTKVDVVALQIEAAANQTLSGVSWLSTINGAQEETHELPPPAEPRYAVYQPNLYLDELQLSDWDLMTYYARAKTEKENAFASDVYFIEVRPFREDILKMPGGEDGKAYRALSEMTALINRQQHVIRQTHLHVQRPPPDEHLASQDRGKLSEAEGDLRDSTEHLYASMAAQMENAPIGVALDNLAKAGRSLGNASDLLKQNAMTEAPGRERDALTELVAARKMFQKAVNDNPDAFGDGEKNGDDPPRVALDESKKLQKMAEFRNEARAGRQFVNKAVEQQRSIERQSQVKSNDLANLAQQERQLQQSLEEFQQQHPDLFKGAQPEFQNAQEAMSQAADKLQERGKEAPTATAQATQQLQKLSDTLNGRSEGQELADAYKLKNMLDGQARNLDEFNKTGTNRSPNVDVQKTASQARETIDQLKKVAEQEPTRDAFGQPLRDSLAGTNKVELDSLLNQLQQAQGSASQQARAGEARDALNEVSRAFEASQPKSLQMAGKSDALKPDPQGSFALGLSQLESLLKQLQKEQKISPKDQARQGKEALYNLQMAMESPNGSNESGEQILLHLEELLKPEQPIEIEDLRKLLAELEHFSVESSDHFAKRDDPNVTNIDPSRFPPAYRGRIQKYFQKLSEK